MTFACHGAMFATISVLCSRDDNILIPNPTFPLAVTLCQNLGVEYRQYNLLVSENGLFTTIIYSLIKIGRLTWNILKA